MNDFENPVHEMDQPPDIYSPGQQLGSVGLSETVNLDTLDAGPNDSAAIQALSQARRPACRQVTFFEQSGDDFKHWPC